MILRAFDSRVVAVPGDLERTGLGLSQAVWTQLASELETIYHNGALVRDSMRVDGGLRLVN
jgi:thioester reductase-like protein